MSAGKYPFFIRLLELAHLERMLTGSPSSSEANSLNREHCRLLTITGPAGCGKTRLAAETARCISRLGTHTTIFVCLADISEPERILEIVAANMDVPSSVHTDLITAIALRIGVQPHIIVLDNFEQLLDPFTMGVAEKAVLSILERCLTASLLITSRQCLGISGETEYTVDTLDIPDPSLPVQELIKFPSVQLFVDRAQLVLADFQITSRNAATIASLCARLDGLPLAIELAATWCKILTPAQILTRAQARIAPLGSRSKGRTSRHQTLHAAILWSYELLSSELQIFFTRLSVFRGGWSLEAAAAICLEDADVSQHQSSEHALELLRALADRSLVMIRTTGEGISEETRFSFLESIREFADGQLSEDEKRELLKRHITYYSELGVILYPNLNGQDQADWLKRVGLDHENLSLALETCLANRSAHSVLHGLTILGCFSQFFKLHGNYNRLRRDIELLLQAPVSPVYSEPRARVLSLAATLAIFQMDLQSARRYYCDMLSITENVHPAMAAGSRVCLGWIAIQTDNDLPFARSCYSMALTEYTTAGSRAGIAATYGALAQLDSLDGDYPSAIERLRACVEIQRDHNNLSGVTHFLRELAAIYTSAGQLKEALSCLRESLEGYVQLCDARGLAELYVSIANASPHDDEAIALLGTADVINANVSVANPLIEVVVSRARKELGAARFEAARIYGSKLKYDEALNIARRLTAGSAELELESGDLRS